MAWNATIPTVSSKISDIPADYQANWEAVDNFYDQEHYGFDSTASGSHKPGLTAVVSACSGSPDFTANTVALNNVLASGDGWGTLMLDTRTGVMNFTQNNLRVFNEGFIVGSSLTNVNTAGCGKWFLTNTTALTTGRIVQHSEVTAYGSFCYSTSIAGTDRISWSQDYNSISALYYLNMHLTVKVATAELIYVALYRYNTMGIYDTPCSVNKYLQNPNVYYSLDFPFHMFVKPTDRLMISVGFSSGSNTMTLSGGETATYFMARGIV